MHLAFDQPDPRLFVQVVRQGFERAADKSLIVGIALRQRVGPGQEPAQDAVFTPTLVDWQGCVRVVRIFHSPARSDA